VETYDRHANTLGSLGLLIIEDIEFAKDAAVKVFVTLRRTPPTSTWRIRPFAPYWLAMSTPPCACERKTRCGPGQRVKTCEFLDHDESDGGLRASRNTRGCCGAPFIVPVSWHRARQVALL
jgi:hypothetical protein